ncbi:MULTISPECIES: MFS transporter [unclassified Rhodococcus (in: high G+C Gram-positive bacteria)]|uniref:MFS transporter n=1 Tax=unclassified Rhodococcus (in: high G+C Gram-positive bacteria) TaxID=192944 RepID=UPI00163A8293|nr:MULTISPECIES: MFS transporter [unclassified Rhodococcus (in: high G+C Gram-positive bacteria)]MBC2642864.1 MFS transporter [Rhodococcus sp. 3A]MBC2892394.1 MFS transporter [Rhodococcus sp. 4CII]
MTAAVRVPLTLRRGIATFSIFVVGYITANLIPLMIIAMVDDLGVTQTVAGAVLTGSLLATALVCLATTRWAAGRSRHLLGRISLVVMAAGFAVAATIHSAPVACVAIIVGGIGAGGAVAVGGAALAALTNPNRVSGINGLVNRTAVTGVLALIPILGTHMTNAFGIVAVLALATAFTIPWLPAAPAVDDGRPSTEHTRNPLPEGVTEKKVAVAGVSLLVLFAIWAIGEDSLWAVSGIMGAEHASLTEQQMGLALSLSTAGGIGAALVLTALGSRLGRTAPTAVLLALGATLKLGSCLATDPTAYLVLVIAWNTVYAAAFIYIVAIAAALDSSGRWSAPLLGTYLVGSAFAPLFGTLVTGAVGYVAFGFVLAGISLVLLVPIVAIARLSTRTEQASASPGQDPAARYTTSTVA